MYDFIRNPAKSISKNTYAKKHYEKWKANGVKTAFPLLSDKELDAIMSYCDNYISLKTRDSIMVCYF